MELVDAASSAADAAAEPPPFCLSSTADGTVLFAQPAVVSDRVASWALRTWGHHPGSRFSAGEAETAVSVGIPGVVAEVCSGTEVLVEENEVVDHRTVNLAGVVSRRRLDSWAVDHAEVDRRVALAAETEAEHQGSVEIDYQGVAKVVDHRVAGIEADHPLDRCSLVEEGIEVDQEVDPSPAEGHLAVDEEVAGFEDLPEAVDLV